MSAGGSVMGFCVPSTTVSPAGSVTVPVPRTCVAAGGFPVAGVVAAGDVGDVVATVPRVVAVAGGPVVTTGLDGPVPVGAGDGAGAPGAAGPEVAVAEPRRLEKWPAARPPAAASEGAVVDDPPDGAGEAPGVSRDRGCRPAASVEWA